MIASKSKNPSGRILVFIPSYNDKAALPRLVSEIHRLGARFQPLVVDDGSPTAVMTDLQIGDCLYAKLSSNFGLGVCTHIAFNHALHHGYSAVVRIDSDGQHRISDIPRMIEALEKGGLDMVAGVRVNQDQSGGSLSRSLIKAYFNVFSRWITGGCAPTDVNTGFIATNAVAVARLNQATLERFPEPEMFISACAAGLRVGSLPIEQDARVEGQSTINILAGMRMFFRFNVFVFGQLMRKILP